METPTARSAHPVLMMPEGVYRCSFCGSRADSVSPIFFDTTDAAPESPVTFANIIWPCGHDNRSSAETSE